MDQARIQLDVEVDQRSADAPLVGTIGHVAHGKSTVVKAISGVMTVRFKNELVRNITIKLGYANAKVRHPFFTFTAHSFFIPWVADLYHLVC